MPARVFGCPFRKQERQLAHALIASLPTARLETPDLDQ
jgi:hypothetical protein